MALAREYIGKYRVIRLVRSGASCSIIECASDVEGKRIALKVLQKENLRNQVQINQLKQEYEVGKDLHHPNIIEIYSFDQSTELPFVAMEYYAFRNLKQILRLDADAWTMAHVEPFMEQAGESLKYLHRKGWVHRDVKPDNFLADLDNIRKQGAVKMIDFSIADKEQKGFNFGKMFSKSKIQGTRSYMAPEQILGKNIDARTDIYSFGCTIFELVARKTPFTGSNPDDLLNQHLKAAPPSLLAVSDDVTPEFNDLVQMMLAKDPKKRPQTAAEFLKRLKDIRVFKSRKIDPASNKPI